ncbi:MAG: 4Fe-4S dicluster domain-containing protein, partial [Gemmatimonadetes bacterium]|nr:4Fe-4S dicluster domain-containing protein [Gemmatimonadota bacterium]
HFNGITEALEATMTVLEESPSAVEHAGSMVLREARRALGPSGGVDFLQGEPEDILIVEFFGESEAEVAARLDRLEQRMVRARQGYAVTRIVDPAAQARVWAMRTAGQNLIANIPGDAKPVAFVEDAAVAPEKLPEFVRRFDGILRRHGTDAGYYGHASVGCLHIRPVVNLKRREGIDQMAAISRDVADLVIEFAGALSGEHGDGIARAGWNEKAFGPALCQAFRDVKAAFDPKGIMNPGKIVDAPPMTENLRYGEGYSTVPVKTRLSFAGEGGFAAAVERCNGSGACHKVKAGSMCPSYMATRREEDSTRGRANALRAALSGALPVDELDSERMFAVLDLCLMCKSCKSECPSHVDMGKLKAEFLHRYYRSHRVPLRSRLVADVHRLNSAMARAAPLANLLTGSAPARWALDAILGLDRRRRLPAVRSRTFESWFRSRRRAGPAPRGRVLFFHDTFTNFNHPEAGMAAVALLEGLGYEVVVVPHVCCGRPMISKGLLDRAAANAGHNVAALFPYVEEGVRIVGIEASCMATLKDEYPDLLPGDPRARAVSGASSMLEELLADTAGDGGPQLRFSSAPKNVALHVHTHEQALIGPGAALKALRLPPGFAVEQIPASCCGLAGAFGYEKEHYEVSMLIGEDRVFPSVRALPPDTDVVVTGFSCREQIEHGTGRRPKFLAEALAAALAQV